MLKWLNFWQKYKFLFAFLGIEMADKNPHVSLAYVPQHDSRGPGDHGINNHCIDLELPAYLSPFCGETIKLQTTYPYANVHHETSIINLVAWA